MDETLLDKLLYKSEGTDLDFKSAQYRFIGGSEKDKAELLKDILAIANAWREGTGYILIGFKDRRPHPAEVLGISEHLDDANLQQFVHGKVKPKLEFRYEEHLYKGKTVGVIAIAKQPRPFYLAHVYGALKSNVVYVRRGSSTDEAEPPEIAKMNSADTGRGEVSIDLAVLNNIGEPLPDAITLRFFRFDALPDYETIRSDDPFRLYSSVWIDNKEYWRKAAEYVRIRNSLVELRFELRNHSGFSLSNTKLEVSVDLLDGQVVQMIAGMDLPKKPERQWNRMSGAWNAANILPREIKLTIDEQSKAPVCHVRFGTLLPGETGKASDSLALVIYKPEKLRLRFRILAGELAVPVESEQLLEVNGLAEKHSIAGLKKLIFT